MITGAASICSFDGFSKSRSRKERGQTGKYNQLIGRDGEGAGLVSAVIRRGTLCSGRRHRHASLDSFITAAYIIMEGAGDKSSHLEVMGNSAT